MYGTAKMCHIKSTWRALVVCFNAKECMPNYNKINNQYANQKFTVTHDVSMHSYSTGLVLFSAVVIYLNTQPVHCGIHFQNTRDYIVAWLSLAIGTLISMPPYVLKFHMYVLF